jgi:hypothetical protein
VISIILSKERENTEKFKTRSNINLEKKNETRSTSVSQAGTAQDLNMNGVFGKNGRAKCPHMPSLSNQSRVFACMVPIICEGKWTDQQKPG